MENYCGVELTLYQARLKKYLDKHRLVVEESVFICPLCLMYRVNIYETTVDIPISRLSQTLCRRLHIFFQNYYTYRTHYRTYMRGKKYLLVEKQATVQPKGSSGASTTW